MCLAVPARVVKILDGYQAEVEIYGNTLTVNVMFIPDVKVGDYLLIHAGCALSRLDEEEARETLRLLEEVV